MKKVSFSKLSGFDKAIINEADKAEGKMRKTAHIGDIAYGDGDIQVSEYKDSIMLNGICIFKRCWKVGEVIAFEQSYKDAGYSPDDVRFGRFNDGWDNAKKVVGEAMPIVLRITERKILRIQDMTDEEILAMGMKRLPKGSIESGGTMGSLILSAEDGGYSRPEIHAMKRMFDRAITRCEGSYDRNPVILLYRFEVERRQLW